MKEIQTPECLFFVKIWAKINKTCQLIKISPRIPIFPKLLPHHVITYYKSESRTATDMNGTLHTYLWAWWAWFFSLTLLILKINTTFGDVQGFFDFSTGFRFSKISVECGLFPPYIAVLVWVDNLFCLSGQEPIHWRAYQGQRSNLLNKQLLSFLDMWFVLRQPL